MHFIFADKFLDKRDNRPQNTWVSLDKFVFFFYSWGEVGRYFRYFKSYALFCYKTENVRNTVSDLNPPGQNNKSCMLRMPMFIFLVSRTSIKFQLSIDKKTIYALWWPTRTEVTLTNLALDRIVCLIRIRSRMFGLLCSLYILHYIEFSPWNLQFKRSDLEREYNKHKIDSPMRRTTKSRSLLCLFYKTRIGMYLYRHESLALHKR